MGAEYVGQGDRDRGGGRIGSKEGGRESKGGGFGISVGGGNRE